MPWNGSIPLSMSSILSEMCFGLTCPWRCRGKFAANLKSDMLATHWQKLYWGASLTLPSFCKASLETWITAICDSIVDQ
ncbi:hypothetical protein F5X96DRAFT_668876 [Biscogniauxia mediterranea]|nr:hypothetical protein F5X96DRAFT_668876 [Biscogniauxia mediterranea]